MSAASAQDGHRGAQRHVLEHPLGIGDTHAYTPMRRGRNSEWGIERHFPRLCDGVGNAVKADVSAFTPYRKAGHEAHTFARIWGVEGLRRF